MIFVTAPDLDTARKIARAALEARVAACANIVPQLESHYWWQGKIENSAEVLIIFKTATGRDLELQKIVLANHPYETPEFIVTPIQSGSGAYLHWIRESVRAL